MCDVTQQKGYCLCNLDHRKVIHSGEVTFDKTTIPGLQKKTTDKYVELKHVEEPIAVYPKRVLLMSC